jgi:hypothetical protein
MDKIRVAIQKNTMANELPEHEFMVAMRKENVFMFSDFVFNSDGSLKNIFSDLNKEELKELLNNIVDQYYKAYGK